MWCPQIISRHHITHKDCVPIKNVIIQARNPHNMQGVAKQEGMMAVLEPGGGTNMLVFIYTCFVVPDTGVIGMKLFLTHLRPQDHLTR